jgi:hypothetical protein
MRSVPREREVAESKITVAYRINELICIAILQYGRHELEREFSWETKRTRSKQTKP